MKIKEWLQKPSVICIFLALLVWSVFGQTLGHGFANYDDPAYIYEHPVIMKGVTLEGLTWIFTHPHASNWYPLTPLSHMLDVQLYGLNPAGHHFTNILLHLATVMALFLVLRNMTGSLWRSAFVAALFAIHPLRVESVAWISERKDVLSGLFFMLTLGAYARYTRVAGGGGRVLSRRYIPVVVLFTLGLMSKPMLVTLPFVLLLLDGWPLRRFATEVRRQRSEEGGRRSGEVHSHQSTTINHQLLFRLVAEKIPLFALSAIFCALTIWAQERAMDVNLPLSWRLGNAVVSTATYIVQTIVPVGLTPFYPHPGTSLSLWKIAASLFVLVCITILLFSKAWKNHSRSTGIHQPLALLVGWLWYLGMLVPVIGVMQVGQQAHADRYTYLPQIGLCLLAVWAVADACARFKHRRTILSVAATLILAALMVSAHRQTARWKDNVSLWTYTLEHTTDNYMAHFSLGEALSSAGRPAEAVRHYEQALQIRPNYADAHYNLAIELAKQGNSADATTHYQQAFQINPNFYQAHYNLGSLFFGAGKTDDARQHYEQALRIKPDHAKAHKDLGTLLVLQGNPAAGLLHYREAVKIQSDEAEFLNNLAWVLATCSDAALRNGAEALEVALAADRLSSGQNAQFLDTLAAAYAEKGNFVEAVAAAQRALALTGQQAHAVLAVDLRARLRLYQKNLPYHEPEGVDQNVER